MQCVFVHERNIFLYTYFKYKDAKVKKNKILRN